MVGEMSICPINWDDYYEHVEMALNIIWDSNLDDQLPTGVKTREFEVTQTHS